MNLPILTIQIRFEHDIVLARQRTAQVAEILRFGRQDQVRFATAVSEVARNAFHYAGGGKVEFLLVDDEFHVRISDQGPGILNLKEILDGNYVSQSGMGLGLVGARRLLPVFNIESEPDKGTTVLLGKAVPYRSVDPDRISQLAAQLMRDVPKTPFEEIQHQNRDLVLTLEELERSRAELKQLNRELEDTNRGVVALYAELDEKAEFLRRASDLKTRFLSNMTHEFRTPVNSVLSLCRILLDRMDGDLTAEQEKQVRFIQKAATDLSELVNDLLDLAKVEAGKITVQPRQFEVHDLFDELRGTLRPLLAQNSSIQLVFDLPAQTIVLKTDEAKVSQILRNLISNALKFTERGEVRVSGRLDSNEHIVFTVADTGVGIPHEHQARVFEEFIQLEGSHHSKVRGTGLGLPITRKLTELLGGRISLQSEPGSGSTFSVTLPLIYPGGGLNAITPGVVRSADPLRHPVLIVDDNAETLFLYEKFFKNTAFQAIPVRSIRDARIALFEAHPIAIFLHIGKEDEKPWGFLHELKTNPQSQHLFIYVVSDNANRERAYALGAKEFHSEPPSPEWVVASATEVAASLPAKLLLLVDDEEAARYALVEKLRKSRFKIVEASNGSEALQKAIELKPQGVFLDFTMPGMDGLQTAKKLRENPATRTIPIILHTAKALTDSEKSFLAEQKIVILSKDQTAREDATETVRSALLEAGITES